MSESPNPTTVEEPETYWLRSRDASDSPRVGGAGYFPRHDVTHPRELSVTDLPPAEGATRALDRSALAREKTIGKWQVFGPADRIDALWPDVVADAADGVLWAAKATTAVGRRELPYDSHVLAVYTPNYLDRADVFRVRERLRSEHGVTEEIGYKPDLYTAEGMGPDNAAEWGLDGPHRYRE